MSLQVIGAGFGRTGTDSMREALNILGFGPCHHMFEVTENPVMKTRWRALMDDDSAPDWDALFEGYRSCVDWPSVHYWRALAARYPDAPVVLTWRDPESWWTSYENTLLRYLRTTEDHAATGYRILNRAFDGRTGDKDHVLSTYRAHRAAVEAEIPAGRLHVHDLGDGWEGLCAHLGVPVPDVPYPNRNSTDEITARMGDES